MAPSHSRHSVQDPDDNAHTPVSAVMLLRQILSVDRFESPLEHSYFFECQKPFPPEFVSLISSCGGGGVDKLGRERGLYLRVAISGGTCRLAVGCIGGCFRMAIVYPMCCIEPHIRDDSDVWRFWGA